MLMDQDQAPQAASVPGSLPEQLTYDPTQGPGTDAWQLSVQHSMELNARERRN